MKDLFSIGEVARLFDINVKTLRYYDETGLLKPEKVNPETGYRYYSTRQFERLNTIMYLKALQVPLERISYFFQSKDTDTMIQILKSQQEEIRIQMHRLQTIEKKIIIENQPDRRCQKLYSGSYTAEIISGTSRLFSEKRISGDR